MAFNFRQVLLAALLGTGLFYFQPPAHAYEYTAWDKGGRGLANLVTFPYEIVRGMIIDVNGPRGGIGIFTGAFRGTFYGVARMVAGAWDFLTFPFPLPAGYRPLMLPEYVIPATPRPKANFGEDRIERVY